MTTPGPLPPELVSHVEAVLEDDEEWRHILQPTPSYLRRQAYGMLGAALLILLVGFCSALAVRQLMAAGMVAAVAILVAAPFCLVASRELRRSAEYLYVITDRRLIILRPRLTGGGLSAASYGPRDLTELTTRPHADGSGDVIFRREPRGNRSVAIGFQGVANAARVRQMIVETFGLKADDLGPR